MLMADHINMMFRNPLIGQTVPGEERFPDMSDPYDAGFRRIAEEVARDLKIPLVQGVYAALLGPSYETRRCWGPATRRRRRSACWRGWARTRWG
jgi:purine-nucleoside phosphorylase